MQVQISLSVKSKETVSVGWETADDTAIAGIDYLAASGVLTFKPGQTNQIVNIATLPRATKNKRKFIIVLSGAINAQISDAIGDCNLVPSLANGPLVKSSLLTNAYNRQNGRGNYFHYNSGTSEGQSIAIEGAFRASRVLQDGNAFEQSAGEWYSLLGTSFLGAVGNGSLRGPMLRQPFPTNSDTITLLHWLFAAKGDVPGQVATYDYVGVASSGKITIPRSDIYKVWMVYPTDATLLYQSPYSPAFDASGNEVQVQINDWKIENGSTIVTIPAGSPTRGQWKVVFGFNQGTIPQGHGFEAYPYWTAISDGYAACAPDTFRWFDIALTEAMKVVTEPKWSMLRAALRKSAVRGQAISDLREVLKPMAGMPVFPTSGSPDGMFCYSTHDKATSGQGGAGSNFWSREADGNIKGVVPAGTIPVQTQIGRVFNDEWRKQTNYQDADGFLWLELSCSSLLGSNGYKLDKAKDVVIKKVASGYELSAFGKKVTASVIEGDLLDGLHGTGNPIVSAPGDKQGTYGKFVTQAAGYVQFTVNSSNEAIAAMKVGETLTETLSYQVEFTGNMFVYVSSTKNYDASKRWYANLKDLPDWSGVVDAFNAGKMVNFYIPRTALKRKDGDGATLEVGTKFENFGISIEHPGGYTVRIGNLRMVKDSSVEARAGSKMPFFPGAMPFAINADTVAQQFVGWNGSPFHGYQLPDYWFVRGPEAAAVHSSLKHSDLIISDPQTGALSAPIAEKDEDGNVKPTAALLMEQQLLFLKAAQQRWQIDGGQAGPFAHTFVLNTPARISIGNPTPHTWVYVNDDPNTRWAGYQVRVVESLSRLTWIARFGAGFKTSRNMAAQMAEDWLSWLNMAWPNLNGTVRGMPTDFPDPRIGAPTANYEEPHIPAVIIRACLWLKMSGYGNSSMHDALILRCWQYIESLWLTKGPMRYTWSTVPDQGEWFGFWHFEIVTTIAMMLDEAKSVRPAAITDAILRERLRYTAQWLKETGVE